MKDFMSWKMEYEDGNIATENYSDIFFDKVKTLYLEFLVDNDEIPDIQISIPRGAKPFFRKRRHISLISQKINELQYIGGYRQRIDGDVFMTAFVVTFQNDLLKTIKLVSDFEFEPIPEEEFDYDLRSLG